MLDFTLHCCPNSSLDEGNDKGDSVQSKDSSVERNQKESDFDDKKQPLKSVSNPLSALNRRKAFRNLKPADKLSLAMEKTEAFPGSSPVLKEYRKCHTARVVVMGDDRVLGRLTKAYHAIR